MEYYSALKIDKVLTPATLWRNLENLNLSERSMSPRPYNIGSVHMEHPETERRVVLPRAERGERHIGRGRDCSWGRGFLEWWWKLSKPHCGGGRRALDMLRASKLCSLNGKIIRYVSNNSIKLFTKK